MFVFILVMYEIYLMCCRMIQLIGLFTLSRSLAKKRHHRRRFVTSEYLIDLQRVMKTGALLKLATDIPDYVRQSLQEVCKHHFSWTATDAQDWRECWSDWIPTRYERKALREGRGRII